MSACRHLKTLRDSVRTVCCDCGAAFNEVCKHPATDREPLEGVKILCTVCGMYYAPLASAAPVPDFYGVFSFPKCPIPDCPERLGDGQHVCSPHFVGLPSRISLKLLFPSTREKAVAEAIAFYRGPVETTATPKTADVVNRELLGQIPDHIHFNDPRYPQWLKVYDEIVNATAPALRESMKLSAGTLASRIVNTLFPVA